MIKVITAYYESAACPMVLIGKTKAGSTIYTRYWGGRLVVRIDPRDPPPQGGAAGEWIISEAVGDDYDDSITYEKLREVTKDVIEWPEHTSDSPPREDRDNGGNCDGGGDDLRRFFS